MTEVLITLPPESAFWLNSEQGMITHAGLLTRRGCCLLEISLLCQLLLPQGTSSSHPLLGFCAVWLAVSPQSPLTPDLTPAISPPCLCPQASCSALSIVLPPVTHLLSHTENRSRLEEWPHIPAYTPHTDQPHSQASLSLLKSISVLLVFSLSHLYSGFSYCFLRKLVLTIILSMPCIFILYLAARWLCLIRI